MKNSSFKQIATQGNPYFLEGFVAIIDIDTKKELFGLRFYEKTGKINCSFGSTSKEKVVENFAKFLDEFIQENL